MDHESDQLRSLAAARISGGELPVHRPSRWVGAPGDGERCSLCRERIGIASVAIEVNRGDGAALTFHGACFRAYVVTSEGRGGDEDLSRTILSAIGM